MERVAKLSKKVLLSYKALPDKKQYIEFFTAVLTVPMLLTVIMINLNNLNTKNNSNTIKPTDTPKQEKIYIPVITNNTSANNTKNLPTPTITPDLSQVVSQNITQTPTACKAGIGSIDITSPAQGDNITDNPVNINIKYDPGNYCAVVWSYRINSGKWSDYDDKSIALYDLQNGNITLDLKIKSIVNGDEKQLTRNFIYNGSSVNPTTVPTPTLSSKTSSSSANTN